jgi:lysozyme
MRGLLLALLLLFLPLPAAGQEPFVRLEEQIITSRSLPIDRMQKMSAQGITFLKAVEDFSPKAYWDAKGYSIGYGFQTWKGRRVTTKYPGRVTMEQADAELAVQIEKYEAIVRAEFPTEMSQHHFDALVSIAYNLGRVNNSILDKARMNRPITVQDFVTTSKARSRFSPVVFARRVREFMVFLGRYEDALFHDMTPRTAYRSLLSHRVRLSSGAM